MAPISTVDSWEPTSKSIKQPSSHPLCPLTATEITNAADLLRTTFPSTADLHFKAITLEEPRKAEIVPYLEAEHNGSSLPTIDRRVFLSYYLRHTVCVIREKPGQAFGIRDS